jgi:hypothetical protein
LIVLGAVGSSGACAEEMSRDELIVLLGKPADRIAAQDAPLVAADGRISAMARQIADLIEANEALAAKLARLEYMHGNRHVDRSEFPLNACRCIEDRT